MSLVVHVDVHDRLRAVRDAQDGPSDDPLRGPLLVSPLPRPERCFSARLTLTGSDIDDRYAEIAINQKVLNVKKLQ